MTRFFMTCSTLRTYLDGKIAGIKARIDALEAAFLNIASGAIEEYSLDTGQSKTRVKKSNIAVLSKTIDSLYNQLVTLEARLYGCGTSTVRPCY